jgi:hypothetical protein
VECAAAYIMHYYSNGRRQSRRPKNIAVASAELVAARFIRKVPCDAFSHDSPTHSRSPEVSSTTFRTQPPNLQPVPLMDIEFAVIASSSDTVCL